MHTYFPLLSSVAPNPCASNPCQNGGSCTSLGNVYSCDCSTTTVPGFTGLTCQIGKIRLVDNNKLRFQLFFCDVKYMQCKTMDYKLLALYRHRVDSSKYYTKY